MPILDNAHPILRRVFEKAAAVFAEKYPRRAIRVVGATREFDTQLRAFKSGKSKLDPRVRPSRHLYTPSLAIDCHIYRVKPEDQPEGGFWQTKPGVPADLILVPNGEFPYDRIQHEYRCFGYEMQSWPDSDLPEARLVWGGSWKPASAIDRWALPRFFDGPHVQMSDRACVQQVQAMLSWCGYDPGVIDGLWGSKTRAALSAYATTNDIPMNLVPGRKFPVPPVLWDALCRAYDGQ